MVVKPAISWITNDSDPLLINDTTVVITSLGNNVSVYSTPAPPLDVVETALTNFSDGVAVAATGSQADTIQKNNLRLILMNLLRQLSSYVLVACQGDMQKLVLSGFPIQKPTRQAIGQLPAPANVTLDHGMTSGSLVAAANPVFGAANYNWKLTPATSGAAPILGQSTASAYTFTGLTPGVNYTVEVNALGAAGLSDWSNPASLFCD
jgi:hypothetical protein